MTPADAAFATLGCRGAAPRWCGTGDGSAAGAASTAGSGTAPSSAALARRLARRLVSDAEVMTVAAVARRHALGWRLVMALARAWSGLIAERRRTRRCRVLLVDETSTRERRRYVTVIVNGGTGRALAMVEHRSSAALVVLRSQRS